MMFDHSCGFLFYYRHYYAAWQYILKMDALLMHSRKPMSIYIYVFLCLAALAVVNAESETMKVAALGRPLLPGMLYDCLDDSFIPGLTLWDNKSLSENLDSHPQPQTYLKFSSSDSLSSKFSLLDLTTSLKASFLAGLVQVGGSGKFLRDTKSSKQQSRSTIFYSETTRYEQLTMSQLGNITYPGGLDLKSATHVVTAVLYGAQAIMVFDRMISEEENKHEMDGKLNAMVKKIPGFSTEANTTFKMTAAEKKMAEKITCTIHSDVRLHQNPTTYMEALDLYKELPALLRNPQKEVPIKVWLYPLHLLNAKAAWVQGEISASVAFETECIIEELGKAERTYNDLSGNALVNSFSDIKDRLQLFQKSFSIYKTMLLEALGRVLPAVRGGEMKEKSLEDILKIHRSSPFNADPLEEWLTTARNELHTLSSHTKSLQGIQIEDSGRLNNTVLNPDVPQVVCLTFTSLKYEDPYISALNEYLKTDRFKDLDGKHSVVSVRSIKKWFNDSELKSKMIYNINVFRGLLKKLEGQKVLFIISAISDPSNPGSSIYLYEHGQLKDKQAQNANWGLGN
ncbi:neoverrucotoxin subunit alpha isoform X1 [Carassius gibelio]|uniref:neoverrucotoxin subunit alpha isoform X1 n=2 Tax=Carassius gibelio TaxID=101364 RepID=UPI0022777D61|nr:neoverrucotoxin subunit alpha isoform X1 [Carassius gibelio]